MKVLGIDIGGSAIKAALIDTLTGEIVGDRLRIVTPSPATPETFTRVISGIRRQLNWQGPIGCGFPAAIRQGQVMTAANINASWIGTNVVTLFNTATGCPVTVVNDADAAGLAEILFGSGQNCSGTTLMITTGTGLGSALFHNGNLVPNTELGHLRLADQVAEDYASAAVKTREGLSYQEWAGRFNLYLQRLEELFWPDLFIIGGEISKEHLQFFPYLSVATKVVPAKLFNDAGIIGAALSVRQHTF